MATTKPQQVGILIILIATVVGTIGSFAVMILGAENQARESARQQKVIKEYQDKSKKQTADLSAKYSPVLSQFKDRVGEFGRDSVTELATEDLLVGDGKAVETPADYSAYYIGWNPKGVTFDSSFDTDGIKLKDPIDPAMGLIPGWTEGVNGMKLGGVRMITIPSDKAYGEKGGGENIPPNTPIRFIVLAIPKVTPVPYPPELMQMTGAGY